MTVTSVPCIDRAALGPLTEVAQGGQGRVYRFSGGDEIPSTGYGELLYKEYGPTAARELRAGALATQVLAATDIRRIGLGSRLAWPLVVVTVGGSTTGFLMQRAPRTFSVDLTMPSGPDRRLGELQFALNGPQYTTRVGLPLNDRWRVLVLRRIASEMSALHRLRIVVGDLSPKNLLVSFRDDPRCFFLDCDAMNVHGESALQQVETADWEVPDGEQLATVDSDAFKFALLVTRLFAQSQDTREVTAVARFDAVLGELAYRGMSRDRSVRPRPADWVAALDAAAAKVSPTGPRATPGPSRHRGASAGERRSSASHGSPGRSGPPPAQAPARRPGTVGVVALAVLVALVVVVLGFALATSGTGRSDPGASPPFPAPGGSTVVAPPDLDTGLVAVDAAAEASSRAAEVVGLVDRHFDAINSGDYDAWQTTVVPERVQEQPRSIWRKGYRSTIDDSVSISSITDDGSGGLAVGLSFVSRQDIADAPPSLPVTRICWSTTWPAEQTPSGLRLAKPSPGSTSGRAC